ncbi:hypothetical protein BKA62DRAFT_756398 [Auriculariales sp. MPI-PUGE-AT-0066]|nr:hypothetical protein BKA62DRAFT_756398 [Auriculariales sp. MPI-PUGE-AT-0066]
MFSPLSYPLMPYNPRFHHYERCNRVDIHPQRSFEQLLADTGALEVFSRFSLANAQHQRHMQAAACYQRERKIARLQQQRVAIAQFQRELHTRRYEERQRRALRQREEAEAISQAVSLALSIAQRLFSEDSREGCQHFFINCVEVPVPAQQQSQPQPGSRTTPARQVRFAETNQTKEFHSSLPVVAPAPKAPVDKTFVPPSSSVRTPVHKNNAKGATHLRVNSTASVSSTSDVSSDADTSPADAFAALAILSTDLDGLVAPSHVWQSEAHRRHALTQLLEQVDGVHSGGNDAVRDVRRALVQRVQHVLEDLSDDQPRKEKAFEIREPVNVATSAPARVEAPAEPEIASPAFSAFSAPAELQGYDVPDTLDAPFEEEERAVGLTSTNTESLVDESVNHQWSTEDPADANPTPRSSIFQLDIHNEVPDVSTRDAAIVGSNSSELDELVSAAVEATPLAVVAGDKTFEESPIVKPLTTAKQTAAERLSDWEDAKGGEEDTFELLEPGRPTNIDVHDDNIRTLFIQVRQTLPFLMTVQHSLHQKTVQVFHEQITAQPWLTNDASALQDIADALVTTVRAALAPVLRECNRAIRPQPRLPKEIWYRIWEELPVSTRVTVTHVCSEWRDAIHWPGLWTSLTIFLKVEADEDGTTTFRTDPAMIREYAARSAQLPLHVKFSIYSDEAEDSQSAARTMSRRYGRILVENSHRLSSIDIRSNNLPILNLFLQSFKTKGLPKLTTLVICNEDPSVPELEIGMPLPELLSLELIGDHVLVDPESFLHFSAPMARKVVCPVTDERSIAMLVRACPAVQNMLLTIEWLRAYGDHTFTENSTPADADVVKKYFHHTPPRRLALGNVTNDSRDVLLPIIYDANIVDFEVILARPFSLDHTTGLSSDTDPKWAIVLRDVQNPVEFWCRSQTVAGEYRHAVVVLGHEGKRRNVWFYWKSWEASRKTFLAGLWATYLATGAVRTLHKLSVGSTVLPELVKSLDVDNGIHQLEIFIETLEDERKLVAWLKTPMDQDARPLGAFAKIERLALYVNLDSRFEPCFASLNSEDLVMLEVLLQRVCDPATRLLQTLTITGVYPEELSPQEATLDLLRKYAERVVLR